jgi:hypothetical protein
MNTVLRSWGWWVLEHPPQSTEPADVEIWMAGD